MGLNSSVVVQNTMSTVTQKSVINKEANEIPKQFEVKALPNPTYAYFNLSVKSDNLNSKIKMRVVDMYGRLIETKNVIANSMIRIGEDYLPGVYIVKVEQDYTEKQIKLIKLPR